MSPDKQGDYLIVISPAIKACRLRSASWIRDMKVIQQDIAFAFRIITDMEVSPRAGHHIRTPP